MSIKTIKFFLNKATVLTKHPSLKSKVLFNFKLSLLSNVVKYTRVGLNISSYPKLTCVFKPFPVFKFFEEGKYFSKSIANLILKIGAKGLYYLISVLNDTCLRFTVKKLRGFLLVVSWHETVCKYEYVWGSCLKTSTSALSLSISNFLLKKKLIMLKESAEVVLDNEVTVSADGSDNSLIFKKNVIKPVLLGGLGFKVKAFFKARLGLRIREFCMKTKFRLFNRLLTYYKASLKKDVLSFYAAWLLKNKLFILNLFWSRKVTLRKLNGFKKKAVVGFLIKLKGLIFKRVLGKSKITLTKKVIDIKTSVKFSLIKGFTLKVVLKVRKPPLNFIYMPKMECQSALSSVVNTAWGGFKTSSIFLYKSDPLFFHRKRTVRGGLVCLRLRLNGCRYGLSVGTNVNGFGEAVKRPALRVFIKKKISIF